jgi:hypothetical protein
VLPGVKTIPKFVDVGTIPVSVPLFRLIMMLAELLFSTIKLVLAVFAAKHVKLVAVVIVGCVWVKVPCLTMPELPDPEPTETEQTP